MEVEESVAEIKAVFT